MDAVQSTTEESMRVRRTESGLHTERPDCSFTWLDKVGELEASDRIMPIPLILPSSYSSDATVLMEELIIEVRRMRRERVGGKLTCTTRQETKLSDFDAKIFMETLKVRSRPSSVRLERPPSFRGITVVLLCVY